ncbi:MAG: CHASE domain-containing protein [Pyrinomonadaceae bacterium]
MDDSSSKKDQARRAWVPYFVLAVGLLLTVLAAYYVQKSNEARDRLQFQNAVEHTQRSIEDRLDTYIALLRGGTALFAASNNQVTREQFEAYVERLNLQGRYPGIQGIGFSARLKPEEKDRVAASLRERGFERGIWPDYQREEYFSIIYLEPLDERNRLAVGFDMFTEPVRRAAMEQARDTGLRAASGRVTLVQEINEKHKQAGFLIYVPVYTSKRPPETVEERRAQLIGFVYSPFRADDLLDETLNTEKHRNVDFQVFDSELMTPEHLLHQSNHNAPVNSSYQPRFQTNTAIEVAGRMWSLAFTTRPEFDMAASGKYLAPSILFGGLFVSLLLFGVTQAQARAHAEAEQAAEGLRQSEEALRATQERYRAFVEQSSEAIWRFEIDPPCPINLSEDEQIEHDYAHGYLAECNDAMAHMYGYSRASEIVGARLSDFLVRDDPANLEYLLAFIRSGYRLTDAESREVDREGQPKFFLNNLVGIVENGLLYRAWGTQRDITERKRVEDAIRFQAHLLDTVEQAVIATDLDGNITYWNRFAETLYGYPASEVAGRNITDVTPADESIKRAEEIMSQLQKGESWSGEMLLRRRDGSVFPALVATSPIYGEDGKFAGVVGLSADITARKRTEEALREADQRAIIEYESLLERITGLAQALGTARDLVTIYRALRDFACVSVPCIGIFVSLYDPQRQVRTATYAWGDETEVDVSELPPMPITTDGPNSRAIRTGQVIITDDYMKATSGSPGVVVGPENNLRPQSSLVMPMAVMGRIIGTIETQSYELKAYRDEHVTALRMAANLAAVAIENVQLFERESRARTVAEESNRMKDEFLATVSHELRTPLTSILGWSRILSSGTLDETTSARAVETIERNAKVQSQIVNDILDVSRIITGKLYLEFHPVELVNVIESVINSARPAAEAKGVHLETVLDSNMNFVMGDADRLQQIVWNLLSNAVKFTDTGGRVQVHLLRANSHAEIKVSDTGQGMGKDFLPFAFDRFRQADASTTRRHGGLGLGLSIVRHLVEMHGGSVEAESAGEGLGSTFTVKLPLAILPSASQTVSDVQAMFESEEPAPSTQSEISGLHVLVVDDEPDALAMVKTVLEERRARVTAVTNADEAIRIVESLKPDVLVSDIGMPEMDGYELIRRIRLLETECARNIPAVALTAYARPEDRERSLAAGFQVHLAKPVEPSKLIFVVAGLAGRTKSFDGNGNEEQG